MKNEHLEQMYRSAESRLYAASIYEDGDIILIELHVNDEDEDPITYEYESIEDARHDLFVWDHGLVKQLAMKGSVVWQLEQLGIMYYRTVESNRLAWYKDGITVIRDTKKSLSAMLGVLTEKFNVDTSSVRYPE